LVFGGTVAVMDSSNSWLVVHVWP
jgi:hypothetical protein